MEKTKNLALNTSAVIDDHDTMPGLFWFRVKELNDKVVIREKDFGIWNEYTWADWGEQSKLVGLGLKTLGLERGDVCSIASEVNKEWLFTDLGAICIGGVCNGVYPTDAPNQVEYLINDSGTRFYFAEDEEQLDKVLEVRDRTPTLKKVIIFDMEGLRHLDDEMCISFGELLELGRQQREKEDVWEAEIAKAKPNDLMILTYTSGTTGAPKGAMISQTNMLFMMNALQNALGVNPNDRQLGFLPLAHVAGRMLYTFAVIQSKSMVHFVENLETIAKDQQEVAPTVHFAVPRVWEKQFSQVSIMQKEATWLGQKLYAWAIGIGQKRADHLIRGESVPMLIKMSYLLADKSILKNIRTLLGIQECRWLSTGAAPIAPELIGWYWALGRPMFELYGQTECTGVATANLPGDMRIGSVGRAVPGVEIALSEEDEILIRSEGVINGYWNKAEKSAETIQQGWLYTGDVGRIDDDGFVYIVDRMKDIIITAGGKNITPSEIENQLKFSAYITDAVVVGDRKPFLSCLVMIDLENVTYFAQENNIPFTNYTSLCHTQEVQDLIGQEIEQVNERVAQVETIKKFRLIDQLLDAEDEELTPTQKLKRKVVNEKYADLIAEMY